MKLKKTPIAKIYEAYSCLADERIKLEENKAMVTSSNGAKTYEVKWSGNNYSSNDNASFWQGYPGYPVIAVLMLKNSLPYDKDIIKYFKNINWHELNNKYKRDYDKVVEEVLANISYSTEKIKESTSKTYDYLINMDINIKRKV